MASSRVNYQVIYDASQIKLPAPGWEFFLPLAIGLMFLPIGLVVIRRHSAWRERLKILAFIAIAALSASLMAVMDLDERRSLAEKRRSTTEYLREGTFSTAEGDASFNIGKAGPAGDPNRYTVMARVGKMTFYFDDWNIRAQPSFYGVPAQGHPRLRIAWRSGRSQPEVLRVEQARP